MESTPTRGYWEEYQNTLALDGRPVVDGARLHATKMEILPSTNPATGDVVAGISVATASEVDTAVNAARRAFDDGRWAGFSAGERKHVLLGLAGLVEEHGKELALLDSLEMGKPVREALGADVPGAAETFRWYAEALDKVTDEIPVTPPGSTALVAREPLGVIGSITPWNYPLEIASWKLAPALALGNSVVHKPPVEASLSALRLAELALEAGLPPGVLNVVPGPGGITGRALAMHAGVDMVAFTGSTAVAKSLLAYSGQSNMKRLALEAGGKSSNIVFGDVTDLAEAAIKSAAAAFYNAGQVCSANCRVLVERSIYEPFIAALLDESRNYVPDNPLEPDAGNGPLVSVNHADRVWRSIQQMKVDGSLLCGGERLSIDGQDSFITPTVVAGLPAGHAALREEIFGPVLTIEVFDEEDEAVRTANDTAYGLAASVWTGSLRRAHEVAGRLRVGTVSVNTVDALGLTTPFGGFKQSGFGRDLSLHAFDNYSALKTTWLQLG